jgi:transcription termination factor Rho
VNITELESKSRDELTEIAREAGISNAANLKKPELVYRLLQSQGDGKGDVAASGVLDVVEDGYGFLRQQRFLPGSSDVYVSQSQIRRFGLRTGDFVTGHVRPPKDSEKYFGLLRVELVNGMSPDVARQRPHFDALTPIFPQEQLKLESDPKNVTQRLIDLVSPVGKGQRGLIVSPPKAGKTTILKQIANGITANHPEVHLMAVLVGERPEEVTDFQRSVNAEVVASTFDEPVEDHTTVAEMALNRAKRLVEGGRDVCIVLDSITRLTRAYNLAVPSSGRTLSGGVDPVALYPPKRFFGAARKLENSGSLTILATALVDTGSRMDDVIYEEFKGTGNMEIHMERRLAEKRVYPALNVNRSGTRKEELLLKPEILQKVWILRKLLYGMDEIEAMELLLDKMKATKNNAEFFDMMRRGG